MIDKKEKNRASAKRLKICDALIVSSSPENYDEILMREAKWYPIPIGEQRIPQIKYLAIYQSAPISSITSIFKVESINYYSYTDSDNIRGLDVSFGSGKKYCVNINRESLKEVSVPLVNKKKAIFGPVYGVYEDILSASCISDIFSLEKYL